MANRLVQPECGRSNPLVAAANLIRQATPVPPVQQLNFAAEFARQQQQQQRQNQPLPQSLHAQAQVQRAQPAAQTQQVRLQTQIAPWAGATQLQAPLQPHMQPWLPTQVQPWLATQMQAHSAAPQVHSQLASSLAHSKLPSELEARSTLPVESQLESAPSTSVQMQPDFDELHEEGNDLAFWQSLAQSYIGPATTDDSSEIQFKNPFEEGLKRLEEGNIPGAVLLFEAAVQREPDRALAWRYLGTTQAQNEMDKSAIKALRRTLELNPDDQEARMAIAVSLVNETQHYEAYKHLLEWLMKHERYGGISASLDEFEELDKVTMEQFARLDKHHEYVRARFIEAARMAPNDPDPQVQNALGLLFNMHGDYTKAVDCFRAALSVRQQDSLLWNRLGATLANGNKSDEAVIAYRRALEISPGFLRSRYNLAISLIHLNLYDEAAKQLIQILNTQAAGQAWAIKTRSITSTSIWNTLRTVATLMNKPELYSMIDGRDLSKCNELLMRSSGEGGAPGAGSASSSS